MSTIFGIIDKNGQSLDQSWLQLMKDDLSHGTPDRSATWHNETTALGNLLTFNTPESLTEILPFNHSESGLTICSDSRIDNRDDVANRLGISAAALKPVSDSSLILEAYQKWGMDCPGQLRGDFSFAVYHEREHQLFLARDHFGMKPLYYFDHPRYFVFSSELRGILALPFFGKRLNTPWLLDFLINIPRDEYDAFYQGIHILPPGHHLCVKDGRATIRKYWELTLPPRLIMKNDREYIEGYKTLFGQAVKARSRSAFPVGAELSGGLDSSSIAAIAQKNLALQGDQLHVFARVLAEQKITEPDHSEEDESAEIGMVCDFCGIRNIHRITMENQKITENIGQMIDVTNSPYNSNYATYNLNVHHAARSAGVRTILSGHGGDQMLSNAGYFVYPGYLKNHRYWKLFTDIRAKGTVHELALLKSLRYMVRLNSHDTSFTKKRREIKKFFKFGVNREIIEKYQLKATYLQNRERAILVPENLQNLISKITDRNLNDRIAITSVMAGHEQIEFRYPMFDVDLIQYYLAVPDGLKHKFRIGRYLQRMAMEDELPPQIQWRSDKRTTINPGLDSIFTNDSAGIKAAFAKLKNDPGNIFNTVFDPEMIQKLMDDDNQNVWLYKSLVNKFIQLIFFQQIVEKIVD